MTLPLPPVVSSSYAGASVSDGVPLAPLTTLRVGPVARRLITCDTTEKVVDVLLKEVAARDIDLVVMGGYGHSRLREFVLGGVTRDVLDRMTVPVLMAH